MLGVNLRAARVTRGLPEVEHVILVGHWLRCVHGAVRQDAGQDEAAPLEQGVADAERVVDAEHVGVERPRDLEPRALVLLVLARNDEDPDEPRRDLEEADVVSALADAVVAGEELERGADTRADREAPLRVGRDPGEHAAVRPDDGRDSSMYIFSLSNDAAFNSAPTLRS